MIGSNTDQVMVALNEAVEKTKDGWATVAQVKKYYKKTTKQDLEDLVAVGEAAKKEIKRRGKYKLCKYRPARGLAAFGGGGLSTSISGGFIRTVT